MAGGSFIAILRITGFLSAVWVSGRISKAFKVSSIVLEILVGLIFSPNLVGLMPSVYTQCQHKYVHDFEAKTNMKDVWCTDEAAIKSLGDLGSDLGHVVEYIQYCDAETKDFKAWAKKGEPDVEPFDAYHGSSHRRLGGGSGSSGPTIKIGKGIFYENRIENSVCVKDADMMRSEECKPFKKMVDCTVTSCKMKVDKLCASQPDWFTLIGHTGVSMMIFESGMHFDFEKSKHVGARACLVAVLGTFLPLLVGMGLIVAFGHSVANGVAAGVALAPTSVGIALKLLLETKQLQKDFGQAILTAAFVDDILSLILFSLLFSITSPQGIQPTTIIFPVVGVIWMILFGSMGVWFWPHAIRTMKEIVPAKTGVASLSSDDEVLLMILFGLLLGYGTLTFFLGTHLWGCFIAGMSFAMLHHAHHVWVRQTKRITSWMLRIFFSCTVAFAIPIKSVVKWEAIWQGTIVGIVACIGTKVFAAPFMGKAKWVIGWAMVGRAEFAYLIAESALSNNIMTEKVFSVCIWALLYATIFAPFIFRYVLQNYAEMERDTDSDIVAAKESLDAKSQTKHELRKVGSTVGADATKDEMKTTMDGHAWGVIPEKNGCRFQVIFPKEKAGDCNLDHTSEIWEVIRSKGMKVVNLSQQCDHDTNYLQFKIQSEDGRMEEESFLRSVQDEIYEELRGTGAHVIFLPQTNALQQPSKLAKITMIADLVSVDCLATIIEQVCGDEAFFVMRSSMELHGKSMLITFLIADAKGKEFQDVTMHGYATDRRQSRAEFGMEHLLLGTGELDDIQPEKLQALKDRVSKAFDSNQRIFIVVDPVTYSMGPLGTPNHDAKTLSMAQRDEPTVEIRFFLENMHYELFEKVLETLARRDVSLLSARLDERAFCQVNVCISSESLTTDLESTIMKELHTQAENLGAVGFMDKTNLEKPLDKQSMTIGSSAGNQLLESAFGSAGV